MARYRGRKRRSFFRRFRRPFRSWRSRRSYTPRKKSFFKKLLPITIIGAIAFAVWKWAVPWIKTKITKK